MVIGGRIEETQQVTERNARRIRKSDYDDGAPEFFKVLMEKISKEGSKHD